MDVIYYSKYSKAELFDVLQNIDQAIHPQNALAAYRALVTNFGVKDDEMREKIVAIKASHIAGDLSPVKP